MLPTKLGLAIAAETKLSKVTEDREAASMKMHDGIADFQKMAMAASPIEDCIEVFLMWQMSRKQHNTGKPPKECVKLTAQQRRGLEKIYQMIKIETNGHILGWLANLAEMAGDKERLAATELMYKIMNGEDIGSNAGKVAELVIGLAK